MPNGDAVFQQSECEIEPQGTAFFFDFDGTLAPIVADPEAVAIEPTVLEAIDKIGHISNGATAIVSGRSIAALDRFLHPLELPASGVHGLERRDATGNHHNGHYDQDSMTALADRIVGFASGHSGLIAETKPGSVALHYRQRPELEGESLMFAEALADTIDGVTLMRGKMVVELRLGGRSKADAVAAFMTEAPFAGRIPLFAGDDVTDEDAFAKVTELGGIGIKIGSGDTNAYWRADSIAAFHRWLGELADAAEDRAFAVGSGGHIREAKQDAGVRNKPHAATPRLHIGA